MRTRHVTAAVVVIIVAAVASCSNGSTRTGPPSPAGTPATTSAGVGGGITAYPVGGPVGLVGTNDKVWVVSPSDGTVIARSVTTGAKVNTVPVGATPLRAAYDGQLIWVTVFGGGRVVAIDPNSGRVVHRVALSGQPEGIAAMAGSLWVVRQAARLLTEVHSDGSLGRSIGLGSEPRLVSAGRDALFVTDFVDGTVTRIDPHTGKRAVSRRLCPGPQGLAEQAGALWVACTTGDEVVSVDERTLRVVGRTKVANEPDAMRASGSRLYVLSTDGPTLQELAPNPASPRVVRSKRLAAAPPLGDQANVDLLISGGRFWVSSYATDQLLSLESSTL